MAEAVVITPSRGWVPLRLGQLWEFRELAYFFVWRELKLRYKQTMLGASWAVLQPALTTIIFTVIFGHLAQLSSDGIPYALFAFAAMAPWAFFSQALSQASKSLTAGSSLITRVYFPRLLLPLGSVLSFFVDLAISTSLLLVLMGIYGRAPGIAILALPLFVLLLAVVSLGASVFLAAMNAQYRDVQYITPFILQIWLFATPIAYSLRLIPEAWRPLYALNPMASVVEGFRWALLGTPSPFNLELAISSAVAVALFVGGAFYFRRMERTFADVL